MIFVYSGGMIERKNQEEVINAYLQMKRKNDAVLLLLGDGPEMDRLKKKAEGNDGILFKGNVSKIERYLQAADVYVSSSKSEGLPNGVLEAMATGLPVLLSNIPQHQEVLDEEKCCGFVYSLGNEEELSELMDRMFSEDLEFIGGNAYNRVHKCFTSEIMSKKYSTLYRRICASV